MKYATIADLMVALGIDRKAATELFRPSGRRRRPLRFTFYSLNKRLAELAVGFPEDKPPTIQDLLAGRLTLISTGEAIRRSPYSKSTLPGSGLPYIRLSKGRARYCASSVAAAAARPKTYSLAQTAYILGLDRTVVKDLILYGRLSATESRVDRRALEILHSDIAVFLTPLLPGWIEPDDWIGYRMASFDTPQATGLLRVWEAIWQVGEGRERFLDLLEDGQFDCIWTPSKNERRITRDSILRYLHEGPRTPGAPHPPLLFQAPSSK